MCAGHRGPDVVIVDNYSRGPVTIRGGGVRGNFSGHVSCIHICRITIRMGVLIDLRLWGWGM